jgi:hypothetical protein
MTFAFDIIKSEELNEEIFDFSPELKESYTENFNFLKYDSHSSIVLLGPEFYFLLSLLCVYPILMATRWCQSRYRNKCKSKIIRTLDKFYDSNFLTRFFMETYIGFGLAGLLNFL